MLGKKAKNRRNIHTSVFVGAYCTDCVLFCGCFQPLTPIFFPPEGIFFLSRGKRFQLVSVSVLFLLLSFRISKALEIVEATDFHGLDGYTRMDNPFIICVNSCFSDKMQPAIRTGPTKGRTIRSPLWAACHSRKNRRATSSLVRLFLMVCVP